MTKSTYHLRINDKYKHILDILTTSSKDTFNLCLFINKIFDTFKLNLYKDVYNFYKKHPKTKKDQLTIFIQLFDKYYNFYINHKQQLKDNNKIIYKHSIQILDNIILTSKNINIWKTKIINLCKNKINYKDKSRFLFYNIVDNILLSFYLKKYYKVKELREQHKIPEIKNKDLLNDVKNKFMPFEIKSVAEIKEKIEKEFGISIKSQQFIFKKLVSQYLGDKHKLVAPDVVYNNIDKFYKNISSYYSLLKLGYKARKPKYKEQKDKMLLCYTASSFKLDKNIIRLTLGKVIGDKYNIIDKKILKYNHRYYYHKKNVLKQTKYKQLSSINKKKYKKVKNGYINKKNLLDKTYLYVKVPSKFKNIKYTEIIIKNDIYYLSIICDDKKTMKKVIPSKSSKKCVSIDLGSKILMSIYNPTGKCYLITGNKLKNSCYMYNRKINKLKSLFSKTKDNKIKVKLNKILNKKTNVINGLINIIINKLVKLYKNSKTTIIIGYNKGWKKNVSLGKTNNKKFYEIPFSKIINKMQEQLIKHGLAVVVTEESYTSKCDALNLEKIGKHEKYNGKRVKRGLFKSKIGKVIHADINGAINIMRKKIKLKSVTGLVYNPCKMSL